MEVSNEYKLLLKFIDTYLPDGFEGIRGDDPMVQQINAMMTKNNQFFYIGDMLQMKILYTCSSIRQSLGIEPTAFDPGILLSITHPDDQERHGVARSKMIKLSNELYRTGGDYVLMSTNLRFQHFRGHYINFLVQAYTFTSPIPRQSTYALFVHTDIDWFGPIKHGYNFYLGNDLSCFRMPDKELIKTGCIFTDRENEILKLIREGMESKDIGEKLFVSPHTIDTHRRNILKKTGYSSTSELIIDLQERGFF